MNEPVVISGKDQVSTFLIPILLSKTSLEKVINQQVKGVIFEDREAANDNLLITVTKADTITLTLKDTVINYRVPLHIWIEKRFALTDVSAEGEIVLDFRTTIRLNKDWALDTDTEIVEHQWVTVPKAKVLGLNLPINLIANRVLNSSREMITNAIDEQIKGSFSLKEYVLETWNLLQQPVLISEEYDSRFKFTPNGLAISPFKTANDTIISTLFIQGFTQVSVGKGGAFFKNTALLPPQIQDFDQKKGFLMRILSDIPFLEAEKIALDSLKGNTYNFGKRVLQIEDIALWKDGNRLAVRVGVEGDFQGNLFLKGLPVFNEKKNLIEMKELDFQLDTKNILLKSANWLFNDLIINKLKENLEYPLDENLLQLKKQIQDQLAAYHLQPGIKLAGNIQELKVKEAFLDAQAIKIFVELKGQLELIIETIPQ